jgi:hypothetical protein
MTKHEPGLWAEEFPEARQPRDGMRTESPVTVDEPPYSEEEHMQI